MTVAYAGPETEALRSIPGLTAEQIQRLLTLIDTPKGGYEKLSDINIWLIDNGASCHMTSDLRIMTEPHDIQSIPIRLPNGSIVVASKQSLVALAKNLAL